MQDREKMLGLAATLGMMGLPKQGAYLLTREQVKTSSNKYDGLDISKQTGTSGQRRARRAAKGGQDGE